MVQVGPLSLRFITLLILAALALFYLAQSSQSATKNYKVRELELTKQGLKEENERLEIETLRLKSLAEAQKLTNSGLEAPK
ncbi:hypothetical protein HYZ64_00945 [Candidatus Berkelbacteria bacterium]|nr:hypothetical protein [Candidatus Berkelbacteria bacterium]